MRGWYIAMLDQISINHLITYQFLRPFWWAAFERNSNTCVRERKLMWRNWKNCVKKPSYFRVSLMLKRLKRTRNHCETDCAKSWKKRFYKNNHTNCSSPIETKNAVRRSIQWNICAKRSQNSNANVTERRTSECVIQNKKSFSVQKCSNFAK